jgi:uncharacterized iron-regulated membrane protein
LHAVSGVYVAGVALLIAGTGLLYTLVWGSAYNLAAVQSGAYEIFLNPPRSESPAAQPRASLDQLVSAISEALPRTTLSISIPEDPGGAVVAFGISPVGPSSDGVVVVDHATTKVLALRRTSEYPAMGWWVTWNYPLHVGSVLGLFTKTIWFMVCVVLILLPVTGLWMWWQRRPAGRAGFPRRPDTLIPKWLVAGIVALSLVLPMLGLSLLLILAGEFAVLRIRRRWGESELIS